MPNPTAKLASFLFKERRPSQTYLELSSSRECLAAGKVKERKRERRERREKIKAKLKNKTLFTKAVKMKNLQKRSPKACKNLLSTYLLQNERSLYRQPQGMKIPKNLTTKLSYWTKE